MVAKVKKSVRPEVSEVVGWTPDESKAASVMKELNIAFTVAVVDAYEQIDWVGIKTNMARTTRSFDPALVEDYTMAMLDGADFPYPILMVTDKGYVPLAGTHRCYAAKEAGRQYIVAYVVEPLIESIQRLVSVMTNRREGARADKEEAMLHAVELVSNKGMSVLEVSALLKVNKATLGTRIRSLRYKAQAQAAGFRKNLPQTVWEKLGKLANNDKVLVATANLIYSQKIGGSDLPTLVSTISEYKTEAQQLAEIEKIGDKMDVVHQHAATNGSTTVAAPKLPNRTSFFRLFHGLQRLVAANPSLEKLQIARGSEEHRRSLNEAKDLCKELLHVLK